MALRACASSLLLAAFSMCGVGMASATFTVNYAAQPGQLNVVDAAGELLTPDPEGHEVRVGTFTPGFDVDANAGDLAALDMEWHPVGTTSIKEILGLPSRFSAMATSDDSFFMGKKIYLWIFKTSDEEPVAAGFANVVEYGIFSKTSGWGFPDPSAVPPFNVISINSSQVDEAYGSASFDAGSLSLAGADCVLEYETWALTAFDAATPVEARWPVVDLDRDGLDNFMEFYLGTDPEHASRSPFSVELSGTSVAFTWQRAKGPCIGRETVESSENLRSWQVRTVPIAILEDLGDRERVRVVLPQPEGGALFLRLLVAQP